MSISDLNGESLYEFLDPVISWQERNLLWRGKNLGSTVAATQYDEIGKGTFRGLFLGDFWNINNHNWRIMGFNYWLNTGLPKCNVNHILIFPDEIIDSEKINDNNTTEGGFLASKFNTTGMNKTKTEIINCFGLDHLLSHTEYLSNAVANGMQSGSVIKDVIIVLPTEWMIFGHSVYKDKSGYLSTEIHIPELSSVQLPGLRANSSLIVEYNSSKYWLRDLFGDKYWLSVHQLGTSDLVYTSTTLGVRPVFGLCKANA